MTMYLFSFCMCELMHVGSWKGIHLAAKGWPFICVNTHILVRVSTFIWMPRNGPGVIPQSLTILSFLLVVCGISMTQGCSVVYGNPVFLPLLPMLELKAHPTLLASLIWILVITQVLGLCTANSSSAELSHAPIFSTPFTCLHSLRNSYTFPFIF